MLTRKGSNFKEIFIKLYRKGDLSYGENVEEIIQNWNQRESRKSESG